MKFIAKHWDEYLTQVMPKSASVTQVTETKRAFYAGACALFESITSMLDPGDEPTDADLAKMYMVHQELKQFNADVKAGRA